MVGGTDAVAELRDEIAKLSPERRAVIRQNFYKAVEGLAALQSALTDVSTPELEAELEFVTQAVAMMDRSDIGKVL